MPYVTIGWPQLGDTERIVPAMIAGLPGMEALGTSFMKQRMEALDIPSVREMVSRLLKGFAEQGLVKLGREQVEVLDAAGLRKMASVT